MSLSDPDSFTAGIGCDRTKARWFGVQAETPLNLSRSEMIRVLNSNVVFDVSGVRSHFHNLMRI